MALNKEHSDFPAYDRKWKELARCLDEELDNLSPPIPGVRDADSMGAVHKKYAKRIKELQTKYAHLFE